MPSRWSGNCPQLDPNPPAELLPKDWPGRHARGMLRGMDRGLTGCSG
ncbi:PaaX family transcriptional regulator C-terminal domain-containing protein [Rhodococcus jostii]